MKLIKNHFQSKNILTRVDWVSKAGSREGEDGVGRGVGFLRIGIRSLGRCKMIEQPPNLFEIKSKTIHVDFYRKKVG